MTSSQTTVSFVERGPVVMALVLGWLVAFYFGIRLQLLYPLFGGYALCVCILLGRLFRYELVPPKGPKIAAWMSGVAFGVLGVGIAHGTFALFQKELPFLAGEVTALFTLLAPTGAFDILAMGCVIVAEELLFRGLLQRMLERVFDSKNVYALYALQILIYALAQMATLSASVFMAGIVLGIGVSALSKWSGSLWPAIVGHAIWTYGVVVIFPLSTT